MRTVGGELPPGGDLTRAAYAAWTAIGTRTPEVDDSLLLLWLDLALGTYHQGADLLADVRRISVTYAWRHAWEAVSEQLDQLRRQ